MNVQVSPTLKRMPLRQQKRMDVGDYWFFIVDTIISQERRYEIIRGNVVVLEFRYDPQLKEVFAIYRSSKEDVVANFPVDWRRNYNDIVYSIGKEIENFAYTLNVNLLEDLIMDQGNVVDIPPFPIYHKVNQV